MPEKVTVLSVRRRRRDGTPRAARTPVPPAEQMRVTFDPHGQPMLKPFPPNVRWMVRAYGD